jgi:hypothetical protein
LPIRLQVIAATRRRFRRRRRLLRLPAAFLQRLVLFDTLYSAFAEFILPPSPRFSSSSLFSDIFSIYFFTPSFLSMPRFISFFLSFILMPKRHYAVHFRY